MTGIEQSSTEKKALSKEEVDKQIGELISKKDDILVSTQELEQKLEKLMPIFFMLMISTTSINTVPT